MLFLVFTGMTIFSLIFSEPRSYEAVAGWEDLRYPILVDVVEIWISFELEPNFVWWICCRNSAARF